MLLFECEQRLLFKAGIGGLRGFPRHEQLSWFRDLPNEASVPVVLGSTGLYSHAGSERRCALTSRMGCGWLWVLCCSVTSRGSS